MKVHLTHYGWYTPRAVTTQNIYMVYGIDKIIQ